MRVPRAGGCRRCSRHCRAWSCNVGVPCSRGGTSPPRASGDQSGQRGEQAAAGELVVDLGHVVLDLFSGGVLAGLLPRLDHLDVVQVEGGARVSLDRLVVRGENLTNLF